MIMIDIDMPDNCDECRFNTEYGFCKAMPDNFCGNTDDRKRPEWCPLKEQEPVKAIADGEDSYMCNNCGTVIGWAELELFGIEEVKYKFCQECGRKVKWE